MKKFVDSQAIGQALQSIFVGNETAKEVSERLGVHPVTVYKWIANMTDRGVPRTHLKVAVRSQIDWENISKELIDKVNGLTPRN